jgi:predicted ATPase
MATQGYAAPEVEQTYARARALCRQIGETPDLFPVLFGLWAFHFAQAELATAHELAEQLLTLAQRVQEPALFLLAHSALALNLFYLGPLSRARANIEQSLALYNPEQHHSLAFLTGHDPKVICLSYAALTLWLLGYPDQALTASHDVLTLAHQQAHPFSLAYAVNLTAMLHHLRRENQAAQARAEAAIALSTEHGFMRWVVHAGILRGWALADQGQSKDGVTQVHRSLVSWQATGVGLLQPYGLALLAEAYGQAGQAEDGLHALAEAKALVDKTGERWYEAELYRLKGELQLQHLAGRGQRYPAPLAEAEAALQQALAIARRQQAKSLELRATVSQSGLWQQQGKRLEARELLAPVYGWFTEGFDTADLQEAKGLLDELS